MYPVSFILISASDLLFAISVFVSKIVWANSFYFYSFYNFKVFLSLWTWDGDIGLVYVLIPVSDISDKPKTRREMTCNGHF